MISVECWTIQWQVLRMQKHRLRIRPTRSLEKKRMGTLEGLERGVVFWWVSCAATTADESRSIAAALALHRLPHTSRYILVRSSLS
jgi:hypothetical protein